MDPWQNSELSQAQLIARLAHRHYLDDVSKVELAKESGLSRFKIARLLAKGREDGIIRIEILEPTTDLPRFSRPLGEHLRLEQVRVIDARGSRPQLRDQLGAMGATLLAELSGPGDTIGIGWGRTMAAVASRLAPPESISLVQITGAVYRDSVRSPVELARAAVERCAGIALAVNEPLFVGEPAGGHHRLDGTGYPLRLFDQLDIAVVSIGSWGPAGTLLHQEFPPMIRERLDRIGPAAEVAGIWFDALGRIVAPEVTRLCITVDSNQLLAATNVIAVAEGTDKAEAIRAAAASGMLTGLVTDRETAEQVMKLPPIHNQILRRA